MSPGRLIGVLILCGALAAFIWLLTRPPAPLPPQAVDPDALPALLQRLNIGVAHLENNQLEDAVRDFDELAAQLPDEVAPARNLMVARLLGLDGANPASDEGQAMLQTANDALDELQRIDPDSLETHVLAARLAAHRNEIDIAMQRLQQAAALDPDDLSIWYEQFHVGQFSTDPAVRQQALAALERVFEIAPTNLVVLLELLQIQESAEDPAILETLQAGAPRWEQLAPGVQQRTRIDLEELVVDAVTAAEAGNWPDVKVNVLRLKNVVMPEEATHSDRRLVERHTLDFVRDELSPPLMALANHADTDEDGPPIQFVAADASWQPPKDGPVSAVAWGDFNLDAHVDIAGLRDGHIEIYGHEEDAWTLLIAHATDADVTGIVALDLDDDVDAGPLPEESLDEAGHPLCHRADLDVILFGPAAVVALENAAAEDGRTLRALELPGELSSPAGLRTVIPADLDIDGDLDLLTLSDAGIGLWTNRGNLTFTRELMSLSGVAEGEIFTAALPLDWDDDLDPDVVVASASGPIGLLENLRHGEFQWRELSGGVGMSVTTIEPLDHDGRWDLLVAGDGGLRRLRAEDGGAGLLQLGEPEIVVEGPVNDVQIADLNNDGWLDAVCASAGEILVLSGGADGSLFRAPTAAPADSLPSDVSAVNVVDLNGDGKPDLLCAGPDGMEVAINATESEFGWIDVSLRAEQIKGSDLAASGRVNHYGIGSVLELRRGLHRQRQLVRAPSVHFGLGDDEQADAVRVLWTNGVPENVIEPKSPAFVCERQTLKGSCPYLYGWNGERFVFITDLCWAAPLGLLSADGMIMPDRPWEYLKIDHSQLQQREGRYELRLTEELWEAAYFDSVRLFAVDHPEDVEIFTNEKVGPPSIAEHRLYTVRNPRVPVAATDQRGRDVLPLIREADEQYVKLFDRRLKQGYTEPTTLELDLGELTDPKQITLFLTGWIHPTDTTINVALSQNPDLPGPAPPSLAVPDVQGEWRTVIPNTGFPGGKTKTIAIDLSAVFLTDDYRVRLSTTQALYWDKIFFTVDEERAEMRETELTLTRAELRLRGVSARIGHPQFGPERYDYDTVLPSPWPPMGGRFTRLGDVRELLTDDDDRLLVIGSGDEVVLEFDAPDDPPPGWVRDFVIRNVGWDKDADLQTIYGQTVEPLPYRGMSSYPFALEDTPPQSPDYQDYLRSMQTRRFPRRIP